MSNVVVKIPRKRSKRVKFIAQIIALDEANGKINLLTEANELLEEQKTSAAEQAADIVAKQGVEAPVEESKNTEANTDGKSLDELWKEYNAISDQDDRRAFYLEHIKPLRK